MLLDKPVQSQTQQGYNSTTVSLLLRSKWVFADSNCFKVEYGNT